MRFAPLLLLTACCTAPINQDALAGLRVKFDSVVCTTTACVTARYNAAAALTEAASDGCKLDDARRAVATLEEARKP